MKLHALSCLACILIGTPVHGSILLNGSFESPVVPTNTISTTDPTSWTIAGAEQRLINGDVSPGFPLPEEGSQYLFLSNGSSAAQSFSISSTMTFSLSWFDSTEFNGPGNASPYNVSILNSANSPVVNLNFDANALALRMWNPRLLTLLLTADTYTLRFQGNAPLNGEGTFLDNVALDPQPTGAVPEASALLVWLTLGSIASATYWRMKG